jgi:hypothetical protein
MAHFYLARVAELADAPDLGSGGQPWGFKSLHAHHVLRKWLSGRASPCQGEGRGFESRLPLHYVPLAQPDRAFDYESKGREFESLRARHTHSGRSSAW